MSDTEQAGNRHETRDAIDHNNTPDIDITLRTIVVRESDSEAQMWQAQVETEGGEWGVRGDTREEALAEAGRILKGDNGGKAESIDE